jgi:hypothetical protein
VERLRELHAGAVGVDRSRAALLLGLAIADLVADLPSDDRSLPALAEEGVLRLDEGETSPAPPAWIAAIEHAKEVLGSKLQPQGSLFYRFRPEVFALLQGAKLDAGMLRSLMAANRLIAPDGPEGGPQRVLNQSVMEMLDLIEALDAGRWRPEHDQTLADLRQVVSDLAAAGRLDHKLSALARLMPALVRGRRYMSILNSLQDADRPELDEAIADLETAVALLRDAGHPIDAFISATRFYIGGLLLARVSLDFPGGRSRNQSSVDSAIRLLRRAQDHLAEVPPAWADQVQPVLINIRTSVAAMERGRREVRDAGGDGREPLAPVAVPKRSVDLPDREPPPAMKVPPPMAAPSGATEPVRPQWSHEELGLPGAADIQLLQHAWEGMRLLFSLVSDEDPTLAPLQSMAGIAVVAEAALSGRWTPEQDHALTELRQVADRVTAGGEGPGSAEAAMARGGLAMARAIRCGILANSPRPEDWPDAAELNEVVAELEAVLDVPPEAGLSFDSSAGPVRAMAGLLLLKLVGENGNDHGWDESARNTASQLLARAREHLAKVPPEVLTGVVDLVEITRFERLLSGDDETGHGAAPFSGDHDDSFDAGADDVHQLMAMANQAWRAGDPADLDAAISALRTVRRGLPAGHPEHATVLSRLADLLGRRAARIDSPDDLVDALDAAIEAVRVAAPKSAMDVSMRLVRLLGMVVTDDQRVGPFEPAEAALSDALAAADPDNTSLRLILTIGIGAARSLRGRTYGDEGMRRLARDAFADAEQMLAEPEPTEEWVVPAWMLLSWTLSQALLGGDMEAGALAARLAGQLETLLVRNPELAERVADRLGPAPFDLGSGGHGLLQVLRAMKELVSSMAGSGPLASIVRNNRKNHVAFNTKVVAARVPVASPPAEKTRRLARRGLDRARHALGTYRSAASAWRPLARADRPDPQLLRAVSADLHTALAGGLDDNSVRLHVNATLGVCLAELYWLGVPGPQGPPGQDAEPSMEEDRALTLTLLDAIEHLDRSLAGSEHVVPTVERADLMDVLARCYRESARRGLSDDARHDAERTARAALRELARCVLVADDTEQALAVAARANEIVARAVGWCLADGRPRAAVEVAEAGRSLVLASVVLAGRVEEVLRGAGEHAVADAWRRGDTPGKLAGLNALWKTRFGDSVLATPRAEEVSALLMATAMDGVVYLVPPAQHDSPAPGSAVPAASVGHALLVRPGFSFQVEVVELPGVAMGAGTPLGDYLAAFNAAQEAHDARSWCPDGFRGSPLGRAWADALDELGAWTHANIVGPLVEHIRGWSLDHMPHLALVALGELAAIPYAAAWTEDPAAPGRRRFAIHDLVLTHTVSARLLGDVVRRPRQRLTERVVLVTDPTGEFPYVRAAATALAGRLYPNAEVYGRKTAPNGPASTDRLLAALPGQDRPGAAMLHLSTHATTKPTARLQTADGWLPLSRILEQARSRPPDAAGGLIITSACLTDSARSHYDESVTLATALLAAGATGVIGTRWPIDDDTTATLTYHLHHRLAHGHSPAHALRLAQLDLLDPDGRLRPGLHPHLAALPHSRLAHPASWAGYIHHGI